MFLDAETLDRLASEQDAASIILDLGLDLKAAADASEEHLANHRPAVVLTLYADTPASKIRILETLEVLCEARIPFKTRFVVEKANPEQANPEPEKQD